MSFRNSPNRYAIMLVALLSLQTARAHDLVDTPEWCAGGTVAYVGHFNFSPELLAAYAQCVRSGQCSQGGGTDGPGGTVNPVIGPGFQSPKSAATPIATPTLGGAPSLPGAREVGIELQCGEFDPFKVDTKELDDYIIARSLAFQHCSQFAQSPSLTPNSGESVPVILAPASYEQPNHHEIYRLTEGLSGMCGLCQPPVGSGKAGANDAAATTARDASSSPSVPQSQR